MKPRGRRTEPLRNKVVPAVTERRSFMGSNSRDSRRGNDLGNISMTNSFGMLGKDLEVPEVRETVMMNGANKENENISNQMQGGNRGVSGKEIVFGSQGKGSGRGPQEGYKVQKSGNTKGPAQNQVKPKQQKVNRSMRGLVFGPVTEKAELLVNGKRLRIEKENLGRPGGCFTTTSLSRSAEDDETRSRMEEMGPAKSISGETSNGPDLALQRASLERMTGLQDA